MQRFSGLSLIFCGMGFYFLLRPGVDVGAHMSHTTGSPMSQRLNDGFNWPPAGISAVQPVRISPVAVRRAGLAILAASSSVVPALPVIMYPCRAELRASSFVVVGQPANCACLGNWSSRVRPSSVSVAMPGVSFQSRAEAVTHPLCDEEQSLSDVRGADARSAEIDRPDGVTRCFQVSVYSVEPRKAVARRNLLSKDDWRAALADEIEPGGPEVAFVIEPSPLSGGAEGLAGAASGPDGPVVGPAGESEGVGPDADAGESMELRRGGDLFWLEVCDGTGIDSSGGDVPLSREVLQPGGGERVDLIVDGRADIHG
jgi:hypothetical protein